LLIEIDELASIVFVIDPAEGVNAGPCGPVGPAGPCIP
jgi:hypothetical protein